MIIMIIIKMVKIPKKLIEANLSEVISYNKHQKSIFA